MHRPALILLAAALGCGAPPELVELQSSENAIIYGGTPTGARDQAVAALLISSGGTAQPFCSGTLIAPRVVLTAAHCIVPQFTPSDGKVFFGELLESPLVDYGQLIDVEATAIHPSYDDVATSNDIGLIELASSPVGIVPIPHLSPARAVSSNDVGAPIRMLGFGLTEDPFLGTGPAVMERRLEFTGSIAQVCAGPSPCGGLVGRAFAYDHGAGGPCSGDSGGPALITRDGREYVAGVNSTIAAPLVAGTTQADCLNAEAGVETTVDAFDSFIDDFITDRDLEYDACAPGNHGCDEEHGVCENTHGAWTCAGCIEGYDGDGVACTDIDECALYLDDCGAAECINQPGGFTCGDCPTGYELQGSLCADVDECALDICDPLAGCTNHLGSFSCGACPMDTVDINGDGTACVSEEVAGVLIDNTVVGASCAAVTSPGWLVALLLLRRRRR